MMSAAPEKHLKADRGQIEAFVSALFKHAQPGTFVSLRSFHDDDSTKSFAIACVPVDDLNRVAEAAWRHAERAAAAPRKVVFCPPASYSTRLDKALS
jgi:hypothetical protein